MGKLMTCSYQFADSSITDVRSINDSFALGTLDIMYLGDNPNGTNFSRESVDAALPSLRNVPIVCNYKPDEKAIGGHDFEVAKMDDGTMYLRALTVPCGVVTDHSKLSYVEKEDSEGVTHTYLRAEDVVLWKRQDVIRHIVNDMNGHIAHSMEIDVTDGEKNKDGVYEVKSFQFTALCLLGDCLPCFDGSGLDIYSADGAVGLKEKIEEMMNDIKANYSLIVAAAENSGDNNITTSKGGEMQMENTKDMTFSDNAQVAQTDEPVATTTDEPAVDDGAGTQMEFELNNNLRDSINRAAMQPKTIRWGEEYSKYWLVDYDVAAGAVYLEERCTGVLYGFPFTMDGDNVVIDFENGTRKKFAIVDYIDGDAASDAYSKAVSEDMSGMIEFAEKAKADADAMAAEIETYKSNAEAMQNELTQLKAFKAEIEAKQDTANRAAVFAKFTDLDGNEMFEALRADSADLSVESLEDKCYAIRGRVMSAVPAQTYSAKSTGTKICLDKTNDAGADDDKPYGGIVEQYT